MKTAEVDLENLAETAKVCVLFVWERRGCWMFVFFLGGWEGQLMVNCWFGTRWFWDSWDTPKESHPGIPNYPNHQTPQSNN